MSIALNNLLQELWKVKSRRAYREHVKTKGKKLYEAESVKSSAEQVWSAWTKRWQHPHIIYPNPISSCKTIISKKGKKKKNISFVVNPPTPMPWQKKRKLKRLIDVDKRGLVYKFRRVWAGLTEYIVYMLAKIRQEELDLNFLTGGLSMVKNSDILLRSVVRRACIDHE